MFGYTASVPLTWTAIGLLMVALTLWAQVPIRYEIPFPNRAHHEAEIRVCLTDLQPGTLELRMSHTSPGRYALHEFAKNVYNFRATDASGRSLGRVSRASARSQAGDDTLRRNGLPRSGRRRSRIAKTDGHGWGCRRSRTR